MLRGVGRDESLKMRVESLEFREEVAQEIVSPHGKMPKVSSLCNCGTNEYIKIDNHIVNINNL